MASFRARIFNAFVRLLIKRKNWGRDEFALAQRARRVFGAPKFLQWISGLGVVVRPLVDGPLGGERLAVKTPDPRALILYIHGGGYVSCSPATHRPIAAELARLTNFRVFSIDYRQAPEHRFPAAHDDVFAAYKSLMRQFPDAVVAVAGDSAGAGLALGLMLRAADEDVALPACGVCFSAWTDMTVSGVSARKNDEDDPMFYASNIRDFAAAYLGEWDGADIYASPVFGDFTAMPPVLFQTASTEVLGDDSRRVYEKIRAGGGHSELQVFDGVFHGWQMAVGILPEADAAMKNAAEFIRRHALSTIS